MGDSGAVEVADGLDGCREIVWYAHFPRLFVPRHDACCAVLRRMQRNDPCGEPCRRCDQRSHLAERVQARIGSETVLEALDGDIHRGGSR